MNTSSRITSWRRLTLSREIVTTKGSNPITNSSSPSGRSWSRYVVRNAGVLAGQPRELHDEVQPVRAHLDAKQGSPNDEARVLPASLLLRVLDPSATREEKNNRPSQQASLHHILGRQGSSTRQIAIVSPILRSGLPPEAAIARQLQNDFHEIVDRLTQETANLLRRKIVPCWKDPDHHKHL